MALSVLKVAYRCSSGITPKRVTRLISSALCLGNAALTKRRSGGETWMTMCPI